jgi:hypothetical protein
MLSLDEKSLQYKKLASEVKEMKLEIANKQTLEA